ncbi:Zn-dependent hydrolase [Marivita sp. S6314]|uniref:Zn-dependent hydrolase n=1 Tax=Marivita sp. S6314 TaxID=2926406 RepID=UPI001FF2FDC2|nr:Zn-dependent hydrolase [Marivita sp. S6314]MCK0150156.1 Zn-dependent hydrolase [Marivita sp. S6314]
MSYAPDSTANLARFNQTLDASAQIGVGRPGGLSRLALSDADREMRDLFVTWCEEAGLAVTVDACGNIFARREGTEPDVPPVLVGSHLDTQINGGRFDGIAGVLAALEVVRTLNDLGHATRRPLEIVNWTNEEGARFSPPMSASGAFVGAYTTDWVHGLVDDDGLSFGAELARIGYLGDAPCAPRPIDAYFELHIEQGPILDAEGRDIGIVTAGYPSHGMRVSFAGRTAHTGPTPMDQRQNALAAGARWLTMADDIGWAYAAYDGKATAARLVAWPNKAGILSDHAEAVCDVRHPDEKTAGLMAERLRRAASESAARCGCSYKIEDEWHWGGDIFDAGLVASIRAHAARLGFNHRDLQSQAGHDAYFLARHCPTAMIFTPCKDGITHNNEEFCTPESFRAGLNVLLHSVVERADRV